MPDKWWDQMNIYYSLNKHKIERNNDWGILLSENERPIINYLNKQPSEVFEYNGFSSAIEKCTIYDELITNINSSPSNSLIKIAIKKEPLKPDSNFIQRKWQVLINWIISFSKIDYELTPVIERKIANRQKYTIPFIDVRYVIWYMIKETQFVKDYYFQETENQTIIHLLKS